MAQEEGDAVKMCLHEYGIDLIPESEVEKVYLRAVLGDKPEVVVKPESSLLRMVVTLRKAPLTATVTVKP